MLTVSANVVGIEKESSPTTEDFLVLKSTKNRLNANIEMTISFDNNFANLTGHGWRVREIAFSPDGSILASGSSDGTIRLWNLTDGRVLHVLARHHYGVIALDFSNTLDTGIYCIGLCDRNEK